MENNIERGVKKIIFDHGIVRIVDENKIEKNSESECMKQILFDNGVIRIAHDSKVDNNIEPEGVGQIIFDNGIIKLADGNEIQENTAQVGIFVDLKLQETQNKDITDPLYIKPEISERSSSDELTVSRNVAPNKKITKQYVSKHRRNNNVEQHQQQIEILQQWGQKAAVNENLAIQLPQKDNMRQNLPKNPIFRPVTKSVEELKEKLDVGKQDIPIDVLNGSVDCLEKSRDCVKRKIIDLNPNQVQKRQSLPKLKSNASKYIKNIKQKIDSKHHIHFYPGLCEGQRKQLLKVVYEYIWKCRENERAKNPRLYEVTIDHSEFKFQINGPEQVAGSLDKDADDDIVEHPAQSVKKKYQKQEHASENVEPNEPLQVEKPVKYILC